MSEKLLQLGISNPEFYKNEGKLYLTCNDSLLQTIEYIHLGSCQNVCDALSYILVQFTSDFRFGNKLYRQIFGILMGTNCAPL